MRYKKAITGLNGYIPRIMLSASSCLLTIGCANLHTRSNMESSPKSLGEISSGSISPPAPGDNSSLHQFVKNFHSLEPKQGKELNELESLNMAQIISFVKANRPFVNKLNTEGLSPLHLAAICAPELIHYLVEYGGADVNIKSCNPLFQSLPSTDPRRASSEFYPVTPLYLAIECGKLLGVEALWGKGAQLNDDYGNNSLHIAAANGQLEVCKYLCDKGVNINEKNATRSKRTPLQTAVANGKRAVYEYLYGQGANEEDDYGNNPLHIAAANGQLEMCKHLLHHKRVDINAANQLRRTPFYMAAENGYLQVCQYLCAQGADVNIQDKLRWFPLTVAIYEKHEETARYISDKYTDLELKALKNFEGKNVLHLSLEYGIDTPLITYLLNRGCVDPNEKDDNGNTALHTAVQFNRVHAIPLLKNYGSDIGAKNKVGDTPLHIAPRTWSSNFKMIKALLNNGANEYINAKNNNGYTPIWSIIFKKGDCKDLELLLANGANPNVQGKLGLSPLRLATMAIDMPGYTQHLVRYGARLDDRN